MKGNNPKLEVKYSSSFIRDACNKAIELLAEGKTQGYAFMNFWVFIDKEPKQLFMVVPIDELPEQLKGKIIYIGLEE